MRRNSSEKTRYPGVQRVSTSTYRVRAKVKDPRTGETKEIDQLVEGVSAQTAAAIRSERIVAVKEAIAQTSDRKRVGEYAQSWIKSKALEIDKGTGRQYGDVLDKYLLPVFGAFYLDALRRSDVQEWVTRSLTEPRWRGEGKERRKLPPYSVYTVHGWFRVLRTMLRDAIDEHGLDHDPTARIKFPPMPEATEPKGITADQLGRFLEAMRTQFPHHYALTVVMAYTGMRWCHVSALRWEDLAETPDGVVLHVRRKHVRGVIGNVSRKNMPDQLVVPSSWAMGTRLPWAKPFELSTPLASYGLLPSTVA